MRLELDQLRLMRIAQDCGAVRRVGADYGIPCPMCGALLRLQGFPHYSEIACLSCGAKAEESIREFLGLPAEFCTLLPAGEPTEAIMEPEQPSPQIVPYTLAFSSTAPAGKVADAVQRLQALLAGGARPAVEILERLEAEGFSARTISRARQEANIGSRRCGVGWELHLKDEGEA